MPCLQGRYFLITLSCAHHPTQPTLKDPLCYLKGQQELGAGGYLHWQLLAIARKKISIHLVKTLIGGNAHVELSRSTAAEDYVWKEDSRVTGTQFELGTKPLSRARKADWDKILASAKDGKFEEIPSDILIRNYSAIKRIRVDHLVPLCRDNICVRVYWGLTGTGKTHTAHQEIAALGEPYFDKNPLTKWWDGYRAQKLVLIDEFAGRIDIINLLRWLDKYPCTVEIKGFTVPLEADKFWITSNLHPRDWYPDACQAHRDALLRRLHNVTHFVTLPPSV